MKSRERRLLAEAAFKASLDEALTTPKPGLVDADGSGCHEDMDCALFIKSAEALAPFWERQAAVGLDGTPPERAMQPLRAAGVEMERAMLTVTNGINTHKGLIYLMSLLLYGAGSVIAAGGERSADSCARAAAAAARGSVKRELEPLLDKKMTGVPLSNGERLFTEHGVTGVRGEAERGFPSVLKAGLPALRGALDAGAAANDAGLAALLEIMLVCEDSNVMHRGGWSFWRFRYPAMVREAARSFRPLDADYSPLLALERKFMPLRISPGGAADLLSCTYFVNSFSLII
ncbi:MAG: triphosphoribosyl-dephospho-CoA synthase [Synergistaceae bacterium]|nr:triphosphoribosyl-dephospho-CoA synthase [Synergistaceae bacterium]